MLLRNSEVPARKLSRQLLLCMAIRTEVPDDGNTAPGPLDPSGLQFGGRCVHRPLAELLDHQLVLSFWETHVIYYFVFFFTKVVELTIFFNDPTIGEIGLLKFLFVFVCSFFGYADGYTDETAVIIARSCSGELAELVYRAMLTFYIIGVIPRVFDENAPHGCACSVRVDTR